MARRAAIIAVAVFFLAVGGFMLNSRLKAAGTAQKTQYKLTKVELGQVKKTVSASGTLQPWTVVDIKSKAGGRIDDMLVDVGDMVTKGQVLARIDPTDTLLTANTAQADMAAARARERQSAQQYALQVQQSEIAETTAKAQLKSAQASRDAAASRLKTAENQSTTQPKLTSAAIKQAQASLDSAVVTRRQLDATQKSERAAAQAAVDQANANAKNAANNLTRQVALLDKGFVSKQAVDQAQANADVTAAQVRSAQERLDNLEAEQRAAREAADSRVDQARASLDNAKAQSVEVLNRRQGLAEARASLRQAEASVQSAQQALAKARADKANNAIRSLDITTAKATIARNEAVVKNAKITLDQTTVRAPSEGIVLQKLVEEGTIITSGQSLTSTGATLLQLGDVTKMYVNVSVDETDIANVDQGQAVEVNIEAYPGVPFEGKVARVDPQAKVEQNVTLFNVRVELDNSSPTFRLLKPGMNATCEFVIDKKDEVIAVPSEAVREDDQGKYVEVGTGGVPAPPDPKGETPPDPDALVDVKIDKRRVEVGIEGNDTIEIVSGLKEGETVVTQTIEAQVQQAGSPFGGRSPFGGGGGRSGSGGRGGGGGGSGSRGGGRGG